MTDHDPGWPLRGFWRRNTDGLRDLRAVWLLTAVLAPLVGVVMTLRDPHLGDYHRTVLLGGYLVGGALVGEVMSRVLDYVLVFEWSTDAELAQSYRFRFWARVAIAEMPAAVGFITALFTHGVCVYFAGVALGMLGMLRAAPTRRALRRDQETLAASGCRLSLISALRRAQ
ncbi:MAG TPA: hypothetical protein VFR41_00970 [Acidimicrobiia bacterium]|nr:hypothetical protein [Acidimicrobiia bacterium]